MLNGYRNALLLSFLLIMTGCAPKYELPQAPPPPPPKIVTNVPAAEFAKRKPENRNGVMLNDKLLRLSYLNLLATALPRDLSGFSDLRQGPPMEYVISSIAPGTEKAILENCAYYNEISAVIAPVSLDMLRNARNASEFHTPLKLNVGGREYSVVHDRVTWRLKDGGYERLYTMEFRTAGTPAASMPLTVWVIAREDSKGCVLRDKNRYYALDGVKYRIREVIFEKSSKLKELTIENWTPDINAVLAGAGAESFVDANAAETDKTDLEVIINNSLIEWKTKGLPDTIRSSTPEKLKDLTVLVEKNILDIDLKCKKLKDMIDADDRLTPAQNNMKKAPLNARESIHMYEQRVSILTAIAVTLKRSIQ